MFLKSLPFMLVCGQVPLGVDGERLRPARRGPMTQRGLPVPVFSIFPLENVLCLPRDLE